MYTKTIIFAIIFILLGVINGEFQCAISAQPNYLPCNRLRCTEGNDCQCGCGSWCGYDGPPHTNDTIPKCYPAQQYPDHQPQVPTGNPCDISRCPFRSIDAVKCPTGTPKYEYVGASCDVVDNATEACNWVLPGCPSIPPPEGTQCTECTNMPAPPAGESLVCGADGWPQKLFVPGYKCEINNIGECKWQWRGCPSRDCPVGFVEADQLSCYGNDPNICLQFQNTKNVSLFPAECGVTANGGYGCNTEYCGGCNYYLVNPAQEPICVNSTYASCDVIKCKDNYRCQNSYPFCVLNSDCTNTTCEADKTCVMVYSAARYQYEPQCAIIGAPPLSYYDCSVVTCYTGFKCESSTDGDVPFKCVSETKTCTDCSSIPKKKCWDNSTVGGPCYHSLSGLCEWGYQACPVYNPPAPTSGTNCNVSAWGPWICKAPCGKSAKQYRVRTIVTNSTGAGARCPELIEIGVDCTGNETTDCQLVMEGTIVTLDEEIDYFLPPPGTPATTTTGTLPGSTTGTLPGSTTGTLPGSTTGTLPGSTTGTLPGSTTGTLPGSTTGTLPGSTTGTLPGSTTGTPPGSTTGRPPGSTTGTPPRSTTGTTTKNGSYSLHPSLMVVFLMICVIKLWY